MPFVSAQNQASLRARERAVLKTLARAKLTRSLVKHALKHLDAGIKAAEKLINPTPPMRSMKKAMNIMKRPAIQDKTRQRALNDKERSIPITAS